MGLDLDVTPAVLIPRPETEVLVELVISRLSEITNSKPPSHQGTKPPCKDDYCQGANVQHRGLLLSSQLSPTGGWGLGAGDSAKPLFVADIGCGSGAIALSLARYLPDSHVFAVDISLDALAIAQGNATHLGVSDRVTFLQGDLLAPLTDARLHGALHAIVSNPPYIPRDVIPTLDAHVQAEPHLALDGGVDGLDFYRRLAAGAGDYLLPGGLLAVEVGHGQAEQVAELFDTNGFENVEIHYDLAGIGRVVIGTRCHKS